MLVSCTGAAVTNATVPPPPRRPKPRAHHRSRSAAAATTVRCTACAVIEGEGGRGNGVGALQKLPSAPSPTLPRQRPGRAPGLFAACISYLRACRALAAHSAAGEGLAGGCRHVRDSCGHLEGRGSRFDRVRNQGRGDGWEEGESNARVGRGPPNRAPPSHSPLIAPLPDSFRTPCTPRFCIESPQLSTMAAVIAPSAVRATFGVQRPARRSQTVMKAGNWCVSSL